MSARAHIEEIGSLNVNFDTFEIFAGDDVYYASYCVSTVNGGGAVFQDFNALDHRGRDSLVVTTVYSAASINQGQGAIYAQATQVNLY